LLGSNYLHEMLGDNVVKRDYYGVKGDYAWHMRTQHTELSLRMAPRLFRESDVVYCQGPRGGVRLVHVNYWYAMEPAGGYITKNSEAMKQFAWVKLRARNLNSP